MAVYKRNYKRFDGSLTDQRWRFTILPRYAFQTVFESKLVTSYFTMCMLPHLIALVMIYLHYNLGALKSLDLQAMQYLDINGSFFLNLFEVETYMSFLLITIIGPGLIAPDLANNALPLYLSRPFSKAEYVIGKLTVLVALSSLVTWVPGFLLIGIQTNEAGFSWLSENLRIPIGIFVGSWVWIVTISLVALALSAWVKLRPAAVFSMFGIFFVAAGFGNIANIQLQLARPWGLLMDLNAMMRALWNWLLLGEAEYGAESVVRRFGAGAVQALPSWTALASLAAFSVLSLLLLWKKIRACEVVR